VKQRCIPERAERFSIFFRECKIFFSFRLGVLLHIFVSKYVMSQLQRLTLFILKYTNWPFKSQQTGKKNACTIDARTKTGASCWPCVVSGQRLQTFTSTDRASAKMALDNWYVRGEVCDTCLSLIPAVTLANNPARGKASHTCSSGGRPSRHLVGARNNRTASLNLRFCPRNY
jgi:hypothetical protein